MEEKGKVIQMRKDETLASLIETRIMELASSKTQTEIAEQMGFPSSNFLAMVKKGRSKLALNRIEDMARILDMDFKKLFEAALRQYYSEDVIALMRRTFSEAETEEEHDLLEMARRHMGSGYRLSNDTRRKLAEIFRDNGKNTH